MYDIHKNMKYESNCCLPSHRAPKCWGNSALSIIMYLLTLGVKYVRVSTQCGTNYVGATQLQKVISLIKLLLSEISNHKFSILINKENNQDS